MWLFTTTGAYSVVKHKDMPGLFLIRSFSKADMQRLIEANECLHNVEVTEDLSADYHYRIFVPREMLEQVLLNAAKSIDYPNFKSAVFDRQNSNRFETYLQVHNLLKRKIEAEA